MKHWIISFGILGLFLGGGVLAQKSESSCQLIAPQSCYDATFQTVYTGYDETRFNRNGFHFGLQNGEGNFSCTIISENVDVVRVTEDVCTYLNTTSGENLCVKNLVETLPLQKVIKKWILENNTEKYGTTGKEFLWKDLTLNREGVKNYHAYLKSQRAIKLLQENLAPKSSELNKLGLKRGHWENQFEQSVLNCESIFLNDGHYGFCTQYATQLYLDQDCFKTPTEVVETVVTQNCKGLEGNWGLKDGKCVQQFTDNGEESKSIKSCPFITSLEPESESGESISKPEPVTVAVVVPHDVFTGKIQPENAYIPKNTCDAIKRRLAAELLNLKDGGASVSGYQKQNLLDLKAEVDRLGKTNEGCLCGSDEGKLQKLFTALIEGKESSEEKKSAFSWESLLAQSFSTVKAQSVSTPQTTANAKNTCPNPTQIQELLSTCPCYLAKYQDGTSRQLTQNGEVCSCEFNTVISEESKKSLLAQGNAAVLECVCPNSKELYNGQCQDSCPPGEIRNLENQCVPSIYNWTGDEIRPKYLTGSNWNERELRGDATDATYWMQKFGGKITAVLAGVAVLFIAYNSFMMATAAGNEEQVSSARMGIVWAIAGLILIAFAYVLVKTVISLAY